MAQIHHEPSPPQYNSSGKAFLAWVGGKSKLAREIISLMPAHNCYCEVFGGAGWVMFKKTPSNVEIINDINKELTNLYRVIKHHFDEFIRQFEYLLICRDEYERLKLIPPETLTDIQRAVRYYYLVRLSYGGKAVEHNFTVAATRLPPINLSSIKEELEQAHRRLQRVTIENQHYAKIIERFDLPDTLFYLDPPYFDCENYYGKGIFNKKDFELLRDQLRSIKGKFILSLNNVPEIRDIFSEFHLVETSVRWSLGKEYNAANEVIIMNFNPA
ncbi:DNA adenine methylase [Agitococcus lubricus]|uniref:site-specific DNA-methyltransferase (adenine-specific) n=1 Tax=Agitococcus lubricus TaxID=1077255 RepID=A0A2T5J1Q7_9GAMM|nr:DNA adenine methylase [Agitococcus lubricus]PTQ90283.1 DNA adenine methylase [Agitococcus lubricus]